MINIVTLHSTKQKTMVDVGFGANGPISPLSLIDAEESPHIEPASMRLIHSNIPENTDPTQKLWIYQHRISSADDVAWIPQYCFTELEFLPQDYELMNFYTSQSPKSMFTQKIVMARFVLDQNTPTEEIIGTETLMGAEVKRRIKGKVVYGKECKNEEERVWALEDRFGIRLSEAERRGIRNLGTELMG